MMKKGIVLTLLLGLSSSPLWAKPPQNGQSFEQHHSKGEARADKVAEFLDLDENQQALFEAVIEAKTDVHSLKREGHQLKRTIVMGYASGQLSKRDVRQKVEAAQQDALNTHQNAFNANMDFVASLSDAQREKWLQKMDSRSDKEASAHEGPHGSKGHGRLEQMATALELDGSQQALLEELKAAIQETHELHKAGHQSRKAILPQLLKGDISEAELQAKLDAQHEAVAAAQSETIELMFALIDSLSDAQKLSLTTKRTGDHKRPQRSGRPSPHR
jgi:uncharacterized membrane protein